MAGSVIGAQMYTLREHLKTPADIAKTCRRVREMGYEAIQVSAFGPIEPQELGKILREEGLTCAATHVSLDVMKDTARCVDYHQALGCSLPAIGGASIWKPEATEASITAFAREYSQIAAELGKHGLKVGYHNHNHELARIGSRRGLDILIQETDPAVWFEIDVYWITAGGGDPAAWIRKVDGRIPAMHVKDMDITLDRTQKMCEVGSGNLNWPAILHACKEAGVRWYLVERDNGDLDPFESLKISLENLRAMGLQ